ncbi:hypothetical protein GNI_053260 [Gregarina niphandrodes]|uniref:Armadillo/beta-catenin-like repeat protein n=1 Tax=Gregarina niphandrodes TaxID=110365 RepID=A0A023B963_GRENI|nr:hypothetical protein GNI_053260 [Gregarina niphandrodes]EZG71254.1 hypothetical protein GNI_053260 [Gregarina niphandrodes]|eukprot:XP_011129837.1 hypothetical protein GNI_053260 [Gregarina niphandrodes]
MDEAAKTYAEELTAKAHGEDLRAFEAACRAGDVLALVRLLRSPEALPTAVAQNSWIAPARSVSALAASQLGSLASGDDVSAVEQLVGTDAVARLVAMVGEGPDRRDSAILALSFISAAAVPGLAEQLHTANMMTRLVQVIVRAAELSVHPQILAAAAQACRNLFATHEQYKTAFLQARGLDALSEILALEDDDAKLETIYHLDELITDPQTQEVLTQFADPVKNTPIIQQLQQATLSHDEEVVESAKSVLAKLGTAQD